MKFEVQIRGASGIKTRPVEIVRDKKYWQVTLDGRQVDADIAEVAPNTFSILLNGRAFEICVMQGSDGSLQLQTSSEEFTVEVVDPRAWRGRHSAVLAEGRQQIVAPMPGKIVRVLVQEGERVEAGQGLIVVEAMKMQNEIRSSKQGKVEGLHAKEGQPVNAGEVLGWVD
jgi:biotin carboxyl carrier protein